MGRENFCLKCEHVWHGLSDDHCPNCGSEDISTESDWTDGHYEGDMAGRKPDNSVED